MGGILGAMAAVLGVMMPSFVITAFVSHYFFKFKESKLVGGALSGIRPVIPALIFAAVWSMGSTSLIDIPTIAVALIACGLVLKKINPAWIILAAGLIGAVVFS
jgi:chromate transporter